MATYDLTLNLGTVSQPVNGKNDLFYERYIDFASRSLVATDIVNLLDLPAGILIMAIKVEVITAQGAACTADFGTTGTPTKYQSNTNLNALASTLFVTPTYLSAAETLVMTADSTTNLAKIRVQVVAIDMRAKLAVANNLNN